MQIPHKFKLNSAKMSGVAAILVPTKFLIVMTHLLAVLTSTSVKQENVLAGLAKNTALDSTAYTDAESR